MEVLEVRHVDDCFDGSMIRELHLSAEVGKELIFELGLGGRVQYFGHFPKPFFKVAVEGRYDLKGIEGNRTLRVHLKHPNSFSIGMFVQLLENSRRVGA